MKISRVAGLLAAYGVIGLLLLLGLLLVSRWLGASAGATTLIAALGGALVGSLGTVLTSLVTSMSQQRETDERIRDEASKVALDLTRMDYELRQQALKEGESQQFLAPAKVYREFYKAVVELRTKDSWPVAIEQLGLLNVFEVARPMESPF